MGVLSFSIKWVECACGSGLRLRTRWRGNWCGAARCCRAALAVPAQQPLTASHRIARSVACGGSAMMNRSAFRLFFFQERQYVYEYQWWTEDRKGSQEQTTSKETSNEEADLFARRTLSILSNQFSFPLYPPRTPLSPIVSKQPAKEPFRWSFALNRSNSIIHGYFSQLKGVTAKSYKNATRYDFMAAWVKRMYYGWVDRYS